MALGKKPRAYLIHDLMMHGLLELGCLSELITAITTGCCRRRLS